MDVSSNKTFKLFKSPWRCLSRSLFISRNRWKKHTKRLRGEVQETRIQLQQAQRELTRLRNLAQELEQQLKLQAAHSADPLPNWKNLPGSLPN